MFKKKNTDVTELDELIDILQTLLHGLEPDSEDYNTLLGQLERLYKLKALGKERININTLLTILGNLAGILLILNFERVGVVTSKALGFVLKTKL